MIMFGWLSYPLFESASGHYYLALRGDRNVAEFWLSGILLWAMTLIFNCGRTRGKTRAEAVSARSITAVSRGI